jgi:hypothetical protein
VAVGPCDPDRLSRLDQGAAQGVDENGVAAGRSIVAARVQHQLDGQAVAEVWLGCVAGELARVYGAKYVTR